MPKTLFMLQKLHQSQHRVLISYGSAGTDLWALFPEVLTPVPLQDHY